MLINTTKVHIVHFSRIYMDFSVINNCFSQAKIIEKQE